MAYFEVNKKPRLTFPTLTGDIVTFNSQYAGLPLKSHTIALTATQSGSGTPSPSNPRSINGWNGQNIYHSGADTTNPTIEYVAFGSTIYGGNRDARTGVLTVTHNILTVDNFDTNRWRVLGNGIACTFVVWGGSAVYDASYNSNKSAVCNYFKKQSGYTWNISDGEFNIADGYIAFRSDNDFDDVSSAISYFQTLYNNGTPAQFIAKLATPQTIQLPPCPIDTLEGVNNIWADTGDTTLQYPKFG